MMFVLQAVGTKELVLLPVQPAFAQPLAAQNKMCGALLTNVPLQTAGALSKISCQLPDAVPTLSPLFSFILLYCMYICKPPHAFHVIL